MDAPISIKPLVGLTNAEALRRLAEAGPNVLAEKESRPWQAFLGKFWAPLPWMLEAAVAIQIGLGEYVEAAVIGVLLVFNATLGFLQEGRAAAALAALKSRFAPTALVCREGEWVRLPASELVRGDAIRLMLGALIPADALIVSGSVLVDQSMLTGESVPVDANPGSPVYAGSFVRRGQATAEITATGSKTYWGRTVELVRVAHSTSTEQSAVFAASRSLGAVNGTLALLIVVYGHLIGLTSADLIRLALTALLASIPVALPATFTVSAALAAQALARCGVLLTRLSAAHDAASMDVLCSDKTGTLTQNALAIAEVRPMPGYDQTRVLALAALASSEADQDPIDATIRRAAPATSPTTERLVRFVPFDPETKISEAFLVGSDGSETRVVKGAFQVVAEMAAAPAEARSLADDLSGRGRRVIALAVGPQESMHMAGLIALSDPPREDSAKLVAALRDMGVRTVMVTGDAAITAATIAREVGIPGAVCPPERISDDLSADEYGVYARVLPEQKYRLVKALQNHGHVVGMCGDGANDAPALRQAQMGIAVSSATDVAKAAAGMVLTEPGLGGIVLAVREGRIAFQRLLTYTLNMLVKKVEIVLFVAVGLALTGHAVMTPMLMVLMMITNDFLSMSLTTDRAAPAASPSIWRMGSNTAAAVVIGLCKLGFSTAVIAFAYFRLGLTIAELQTLAFVTLVAGNQGLLYALRERRHLWASRPGGFVVLSSLADLAIAATLALSGYLMQPLRWHLLLVLFCAAALFALVLDQVKPPIMKGFRIG